MAEPRRLFLSRLGATATALGVGAAGASAAAAPTEPGGWQAARHQQDDWFDHLPGKHRFYFDVLTPNGAGEALFFANNYFRANKSGYDLDDRDLAVVIGVRHLAAPFALSSAIWTKYAAGIAELTKFMDPKTNQPPTANVYASSSDALLPNHGVTIGSLVDRGVHVAVCDLATHATAGMIARKMGGEADAIYKELIANSVGNCHFVPAGIVAVNRAQEHGYSVVHVG